MANSHVSWAITLDGGTTNTRARLVDVAAGRTVASARRAVGVRDQVLTPGRGERPLERAVREAIADVRRQASGIVPELIAAAGMLTAEVGLTAVPHVAAPASLDSLARGTVVARHASIDALPILFIPGVRTPPAPGPDGWATADVMRGEECETLGAWLALARPATAATTFVWPGSHTKLVEVDRSGAILRSHTTLAGELMHAVAQHTLLAASLPEDFPEDLDPGAVAAGARLAARDGLGRAAFLVRVAALATVMDPRQRAAFWIGAVVADDVAALARHTILAADPAPAVWVGGRQPLRRLYAEQLQACHRAAVEALDDPTAEMASALGALAVARRSLELKGSRDGDTATLTG